VQVKNIIAAEKVGNVK